MDSLYTAPYFSYYNKNVNFSKPIMPPQEDPDYYKFIFSPFNVPELMEGKIIANSRSMLKSIVSPAKNVNFELKN
jgi:hypothetical protein